MNKEQRLHELELQSNIERMAMEDDKKNSNFVMYYREQMSSIRALILESPTASAILSFIIEKMDGGNVVICSYSVFEEYFNFSKSTVTRAIRLLKEKNFVKVLKSGTSNIYIVNKDVAWSSWANNRQYCEFEGKVLITAKENKESIETTKSDKAKSYRIVRLKSKKERK